MSVLRFYVFSFVYHQRWALVALSVGLSVVTADTGLHHWEKASRDPDRIVLTWPGDPATSVAVSWRTDTSCKQGIAELTKSIAEPGFHVSARQFTAKTERIDLQLESHNTQGPVHYHTVEFAGLEPNTKYLYRVGDGQEHFSEWIEFRTASKEAKPFSFVYFGDAQNDVLSKWSRVIRAAYATAPEACFFLHAGDLINDGHYDQEWGEWFKAGGWIHASVPSVVVTGNHEYRKLTGSDDTILSMLWRPQFNLPVVSELSETLHETVYTFDYQGVRFIVLNTNEAVENQVEWLDKTLAENPNKWTVVTYHHPLFSSRENRDNKKLRDLWKPIFDRHSVDLVLQGHDHTYARGHTPLSMREDNSSSAVQTMYVNSVSGPKMYEFMKTGWDVYQPDGVVLDRRGENAQFFQVISVNGNALSYQAYTATGEVYDAFRLDKDEKGNKTLMREPVEVGEEYRFLNTAPYQR
jgi:3',5'-cyclic AMP phosphodiesterase CpdA